MSAGFARVARVGSAIARRFATVTVDPLPADLPGSVVVGNHTSLFDIFVGWEALRRWDRPVHFLVRAQYVDTPVIGPVLRAAGAIPVRDPRAPGAGFTLAAETLAAGGDVLLMPEGHLAGADERAADGVGAFYNGVGKLLALADVPVVIAYVSGAEQVWPQGRRLPRRAGRTGKPTITVRFVVARLEPTVERNPEVITALVRSAMVRLAHGDGLPDGLEPFAPVDELEEWLAEMNRPSRPRAAIVTPVPSAPSTQSMPSTQSLPSMPSTQSIPSEVAPRRASSSATSSGAATWR